jgi:hypothetical protein
MLMVSPNVPVIPELEAVATIAVMKKSRRYRHYFIHEFKYSYEKSKKPNDPFVSRTEAEGSDEEGVVADDGRRLEMWQRQGDELEVGTVGSRHERVRHRITLVVTGRKVIRHHRADRLK